MSYISRNHTKKKTPCSNKEDYYYTGAFFFANGQATLLATNHAYLGAYVISTAKYRRRTQKPIA
jgi:Rad3-related DNA helicase